MGRGRVSRLQNCERIACATVCVPKLSQSGLGVQMVEIYLYPSWVASTPARIGRWIFSTSAAAVAVKTAWLNFNSPTPGSTWVSGQRYLVSIADTSPESANASVVQGVWQDRVFYITAKTAQTEIRCWVHDSVQLQCSDECTLGGTGGYLVLGAVQYLSSLSRQTETNNCTSILSPELL